MTDRQPLPISDDELLVVVSDLWDATFGCPVVHVGTEPEPGSQLWAEVDLLDDRGPVALVALVLDRRSAREVARAVFGVDDPLPRQLADVVGEAANIIAGNVKGILRLGTSLSQPRADQGPATPPVEGGSSAVSVRAGDELGRRITVHIVDQRVSTRFETQEA